MLLVNVDSFLTLFSLPLFVSGVISLSTAAPWKYRLSQGVWSQLTQVRVHIPFFVLMLIEILEMREIISQYFWFDDICAATKVGVWIEKGLDHPSPTKKSSTFSLVLASDYLSLSFSVSLLLCDLMQVTWVSLCADFLNYKRGKMLECLN